MKDCKTPRTSARGRPRRRFAGLIATTIFGTTLGQGTAAPLDEAIATQQQMQKMGQKSQKTVEKLDDAAQSMLNEYREANLELENLRVYHRQLRKLIDSQEQEKLELARQLEDIEVTQRSILPLMLRMQEVLDRFVALDAPFLKEERQLRVAELRKLMDRSDVTLAEKYRRLLEAYLVETDYGRTLEAYTGPLTLGERSLTVDFLRFGRLGLYYLTLDGREAGYWDPQKTAWEVLPDEYRSAIGDGLRIARKQAAPDLLKLPVIVSEARP